MNDQPEVLFYSDEQISDMLSHGFQLEPIFRSVVEKGSTVALVANPENDDLIVMDVFSSVEELQEADRRREKVRKQFADKFGIDYR